MKTLRVFILAALALAGPPALGAAYTFESAGAWDSTGTGNAISPALPGTCPNGSLMLLFATTASAAETLTVTNWTELESNTSNGGVKIFGNIKDAGDSAPSVNWSGSSYAAAQIACFSGDVYTDLATIVAHSAVTNGNSTSFNYAALTISTADTLVLIAGKHTKTATTNGITINAEAGFTEISELAPSGSSLIGVWNYVQQTTATNINAGGWDGSVAFESSGWTSVTVSLKTQAASPPSFSSGPTVSAQDDNDYTLSYTPDAAATFYAVACIKDSTAPTVAQVKAGDCTGDVDAIAAVNEAVTGADTTVLTIGGTPRPIHDLYAVLNNAGGDSSLATLADEMLDPPAGMQFITLASIGAGSPCESFNTATNPDLVAGDILRGLTTTSPGSFALTISTACQFSYSGDSSRQLALNILIYDVSAGAYHADDIDFVANNLTPLPPEPDSLTYFVPLNSAMTPVDFTNPAVCTDPEGDTITVTNVDALPTGLSITNSILSGTATVRGKTTDIEMRCTDQYGASVDWE